MSYTKQSWVDRLVQFANRFTKSGETSTSVTLAADPGTVTEAGTPLSSTRLNYMETGIYDAHVTADQALAGGPFGVTAGAANAYTVATTGAFTALADGKLVSVKIHAANTGASTINVNGLGVKAIKKPNGNDLGASALKVDSIYSFRYSATANGGNGAFILQGEGGSGDAQPGDVLSPRKFTNDNGEQTGTLALTGNATDAQVLASQTYYNTDAKTKRTGAMVTRNSGNWGPINPSTANQGIPAGYHDGSTYVLGDPDLNSGNIKAGANIFGVPGDAWIQWTGDVESNDGLVVAGQRYWALGTKRTGTLPNMSGQNPDGIGTGRSNAIQISAASGAGLYLKPRYGYYDGGDTWVYQPDAEFRPENIRSGYEIFGIVGNLRAWNGEKRWASGSTAISGGRITVTGLAFTPNYIISIGPSRADWMANQSFSVYTNYQWPGIGQFGSGIQAAINWSGANFGTATSFLSNPTITSSGFSMAAYVGPAPDYLQNHNWIAFEA